MTEKKKILRRKHYDLPLHRGSGGQLVTWIVGVMNYLTVLMVVLIFALSAIQHYWQAGMTGRMTIEIPYNKEAPLTDDKKAELEKNLSALNGIQAHALSMEDIGKLVGPWLGTSETLQELPLPSLIDITRLDMKDAASNEEIEAAAKKITPDATLDTHEEWLAELMQLAKACRMILMIVSIILALTAAMTVAATARTRLALHKAEVDLLHLIGATDAYIANQFQRQAFRLATEGAGAGLLMAIVTMAIIAVVKQELGDTVVPQLHLTALQWLLLLATPLIAGLVAMISSRFTILHALKEMP